MFKRISIVLVLLMMIGSLSACGSQAKPETTITTFLDAFKTKKVIDYPALFTGDVSEMTKDPFASEETPSEISSKMMEMILSYDYEIKESVVSKDKTTAVVTVTFTTVNIGFVFQTFMMNYLPEAFKLGFSGGTEAEMNQLVIDTFIAASKDAPKDKTTTVDVKMALVDKTWRIIAGDENQLMFDAMMGGLISTVDEYKNQEE